MRSQVLAARSWLPFLGPVWQSESWQAAAYLPPHLLRLMTKVTVTSLAHPLTAGPVALLTNS